MKTFIDLFCGIGGFHLALEKRGLNCVFASDINEPARDSYEANFGFRPHGDITKIAAESIPAHDILCAGFPCQPFSTAGQWKSMEDSRGKLFYEIIRIAKHHKPKAMILENVPSILKINGGEVKREILQSLESIGYKTNYVLLNSGDFGVPQARKRIFFIAIRKDLPLTFNYPLPLPFTAQKSVKEILMPPSETAHLIIKRIKQNDIVFDKPIDPLRENRLNKIGYVGKDRQGEKIYDIGGQAPTQSVSCGRPTGMFYIPHNEIPRHYSLYKENGIVRTLHIDEAKQVMGFPATHVVSEKAEGYKQTGNAVVPACVLAVFDGIIKTQSRGGMPHGKR